MVGIEIGVSISMWSKEAVWKWANPRAFISSNVETVQEPTAAQTLHFPVLLFLFGLFSFSFSFLYSIFCLLFSSFSTPFPFPLTTCLVPVGSKPSFYEIVLAHRHITSFHQATSDFLGRIQVTVSGTLPLMWRLAYQGCLSEGNPAMLGVILRNREHTPSWGVLLQSTCNKRS